MKKNTKGIVKKPNKIKAPITQKSLDKWIFKTLKFNN